MTHPSRAIRPALLVALLSLHAPLAHAQVSRPLPGVTLVRNPSRAMTVIDLCANGVSVRATQYAERRATPQGWAEPRGIDVAINADFFDNPGWTYVVGRARGRGMDWPAGTQNREPGRPYWEFGPRAVLGVGNGTRTPDPGITEIVGGHNVIMLRGATTGPWSTANDGALLNSAHSRTAIGLSADRRTLFLLATANAISASTLVSYLVHDAAQAGAPTVDYATNQDGGGSSQMYLRGLGQIVSTGRLVNNHLGIEANGGTAAPTQCVPRYAATFRAQSFPAATTGAITLTVGQSAVHWIELTNTGTQPWLPRATFLAPTPRDTASPVGGAGWVSATRVSTVSAMVPPGGVFRFPLRFTATRVGDFHQFFGMVEERVTWFSQATLGGGPADNVLQAHVIVRPAPIDAGVPDAGTVTGPDAGLDAGTDDGIDDDVGVAEADLPDDDFLNMADGMFTTPEDADQLDDAGASETTDARDARADVTRDAGDAGDAGVTSTPAGCGCAVPGATPMRSGAGYVIAASAGVFFGRRRRKQR